MSSVARLAFQFAAVVARPFTRHRAKEALKLRSRQDHARICACPLVRQPTTHLHSQSHTIASHARQPASSKDPLPHSSCNTKQSRNSHKHKPTEFPNNQCPQTTSNSFSAPTVTATSLWLHPSNLLVEETQRQTLSPSKRPSTTKRLTRLSPHPQHPRPSLPKSRSPTAPLLKANQQNLNPQI